MRKAIYFLLFVIALSFSSQGKLLDYPSTFPDITTPYLSINYTLTSTGYAGHATNSGDIYGIALSSSSTDPDYYVSGDSFFDVFFELDSSLTPLSGSYVLAGVLYDSTLNPITGNITLLTGTIEKFGFSEEKGSPVMDFEFKTVINNLDSYMPFDADFFAVKLSPILSNPDFTFKNGPSFSNVSGEADTFPVVSTVPSPSAAIGGGVILLLALGKKIVRGMF